MCFFVFFSQNRKSPVPRRDDYPVTGIVSKANFVTANAVDTILAVPRRVGAPEVNYTEKEDYGKVPKYLQQASHLRAHFGCCTIRYSIIVVYVLRSIQY